MNQNFISSMKPTLSLTGPFWPGGQRSRSQEGDSEGAGTDEVPKEKIEREQLMNLILGSSR